MPRKKLICHKCGSGKASYIIYDEPDIGNFNDLARKGSSYILGGCCVAGNFPLYTCKECSHSWGRFDGTSILPLIESIKAYVGGFWGPNCNIDADMSKWQLKRSYTHCDQEEYIDDVIDITPEA